MNLIIQDEVIEKAQDGSFLKGRRVNKTKMSKAVWKPYKSSKNIYSSNNDLSEISLLNKRLDKVNMDIIKELKISSKSKS